MRLHVLVHAVAMKRAQHPAGPFVGLDSTYNTCNSTIRCTLIIQQVWELG